jgi:hypothetical protein
MYRNQCRKRKNMIYLLDQKSKGTRRMDGHRIDFRKKKLHDYGNRATLRLLGCTKNYL